MGQGNIATLDLTTVREDTANELQYRKVTKICS